MYVFRNEVSGQTRTVDMTGWNSLARVAYLNLLAEFWGVDVDSVSCVAD